jgi:hypothetical protein
MHAFMSGSRDPLFDAPFVDVDEWREDPVPHRYVHGGFEATEARFAIHFPAAERYEGRFFHPLYAVPGNEHTVSSGFMPGSQGWVPFATTSGAYFVESNQGQFERFPGQDWTVSGFRASAAVARYSRVLAADMYGEHRPYGYVFGGSGGAFRTVSCFENALGVWDGAVPYIHGTTMSVPNGFTVQFHAIRILRERFPAIVDALEPGGSGDMFAGLNAEEREALAEVTRMGFPPRSWFDAGRISSQYLAVWSDLIDNVRKWDPDYFEDFWTVPGYLGADPSASLARARLRHKTTITAAITSAEAAAMGLPLPRFHSIGSKPDMPVALRLSDVPEGRLEGATLILTTGRASGQVLSVVEVVGNAVITGFGPEHREGMSGIAAGDEVVIDNSVYLAAQTYHRHQVDPAFPQFDQFTVGGQPVYPQRPGLIGPLSVRWSCGAVPTGRFAGKMIVVQNLMDEAAYPSQADYYRGLVNNALGPAIDDNYRLWFIDHAMHGHPTVGPDDPRPVRTTRTINYMGVLHQALRDLADWVENGLIPPASTEYRVVDGQVVVPAGAKARKGIQPVVTLTVNGGPRADVGVGEPVHFDGVAEVPPGAGTIVSAEWDFDGAGDFPEKDDGINGSRSSVRVTASKAFAEPGTYFPTLRVASQRRGDLQTPHTRILNLARVRVVVH